MEHITTAKAVLGVPWPEPMVSALAKLQGKTHRKED